MNRWMKIMTLRFADVSLRRALVVAMTTLVFMLIFTVLPQAVEWFFLRSLFQCWRVVYDYSLGLLPIPSGVWFLLAMIWLGYRTWRARRWRWLNACKVALWAFSMFFWLWGFLYFLPPVCPDIQHNWTSDEVYAWLMEVQGDLENNIACADLPLAENDVRDRLECFLEEKGWPIAGRVRARAWHDGGVWRHCGVSGIYLPWLMEGHLSTSLPPEALPFVRAHEMAHGYGIAREGEADYHAYKALMTPMNRASDSIARWKAQYELWCTLRRLLVQIDAMAFDRAQQTCSPKLTQIHQQVKLNYAQFDGRLAQMGAQSNALYLKTMGMSDGLANYDRWINWLWQEKKAAMQ